MDRFKVKTSYPCAYYISDFISDIEENCLLDSVYSAPKPKWQQLSKRRLQMWGGVPSAKGMICEPLPDYIQPFFNRIVSLGVLDPSHPPNHVLINEYLPGQGIMPHEDGPYYHPVVSTISLGCHTFLDFYKPVSNSDKDCSYDNRYLFSLLLEPRSLVVLSEEMYRSCLHGIAERDIDVVDSEYVTNFDLLNVSMQQQLSVNNKLVRNDTRVSLTIRNVPRTVKLNYQKLLWKK